MAAEPRPGGVLRLLRAGAAQPPHRRAEPGRRPRAHHVLHPARAGGRRGVGPALGGGTWSTDYNSFWCCQGTGIENNTKLMDSIYFFDGTTLTVNLFTPSVLNWSQRGITVTQTTSYPASDTTTCRSPAALPAPGRCGSASGLGRRGHGQRQRHRSEHRHDGRQLRHPHPVLDLGRHGHRAPAHAGASRAANDNPNVVALTYGPVVLSGNYGNTSLSALPTIMAASVTRTSTTRSPSPPPPMDRRSTSARSTTRTASTTRSTGTPTARPAAATPATAWSTRPAGWSSASRTRPLRTVVWPCSGRTTAPPTMTGRLSLTEPPYGCSTATAARYSASRTCPPPTTPAPCNGPTTAPPTTAGPSPITATVPQAAQRPHRQAARHPQRRHHRGRAGRPGPGQRQSGQPVAVHPQRRPTHPEPGQRLVLGVQNMSTADGGLVIQWADSGTTDHLWTAVVDTNGYFRLRNSNSGKVLGVENAGTANGARAMQLGRHRHGRSPLAPALRLGRLLPHPERQRRPRPRRLRRIHRPGGPDPALGRQRNQRPPLAFRVGRGRPQWSSATPPSGPGSGPATCSR